MAERKRYFFVLVLILSIPLPCTIHQKNVAHANPFIVDDKTGSINLAPESLAYFDREEKYSEEELVANKENSPLKLWQKKSFSFGYRKGTLWVRLSIFSKLKEKQTFYFELPAPWTTSIDLYTLSPEGAFSKATYGAGYPFAQRAVPTPNFFLPVVLAPGPNEFLSRVSSKGTLSASLLLHNTDQLMQRVIHIQQFIGLFVGGFVLIWFFNLFLYFSVGDKNYFFYVTYLTSMFLLCGSLLGYNFQLLWPDSPSFNRSMNTATIGLAVIGVYLFVSAFLDTSVTFPRTDRMLKTFAGISVVGTILSFTDFHYRLVAGGLNAIGTIFMVTIFFVAYTAWRNNTPGGKYFFLAWVISIVATLFTSTSVQGFWNFNYYSMVTMPVGVLIEMTLISFALGDRINKTKMEKEQAQLRAIETDKRLVEILQNAKKDLEEKVRQRTCDLEAAKEKAESATRIKDKFISLVSHDLIGPLGTLKGFLQIFADENTKSETIRPIAKQGVETAKSLLDMVDKLLDIGRLQTGTIIPVKTVLNVRLLAIEKVHRIQKTADDKGVTLMNNIPEEATVFADYDLIGEVLLNVVSNAIKFTPKNGTIEIAMASSTCIAVKDTGVGIPEAFLPDIFKLDVKTTTPGTVGEHGTGLGLPLCQDIMKAHGGTLSVETSDRGTIFYIDLMNQ